MARSSLDYEIAEAILERERRFEENRLDYYRPCCRVHDNKCLKVPCPDSKHTAFHLSPKRIRVVFGGNRSSKTFTGTAELLLSSCYDNHPYRKVPNPKNGKWRIYESDFGVMEKMMIPRVKHLIPSHALAEKGKNKAEMWENSYDKQYHILHLKRGVIDFMSYDQDASKSESDELDGVYADEEMPERIYSAVMARLVSRRGFFTMGVTPLYGISWGLQFFESNDPNIEVFNWDIRDNPYNSEEAIRDFESSIPEHEKEARLHGRFLELQGLVYKELRREVHLIKGGRPTKGEPIIFCIDPHPRKDSVMTWAYVTSKGDVVFFDELEMGGTARDIASAVRRKESAMPYPVSLRLIDPAAKAQGSNIAYQTDTLDEFYKEGMSFTLADNSEAGYNVVHEYLTYDPLKQMSVINRPKCFFTEDVPKTWYGMTHLMWDEWAHRNSLKDAKEKIRDYKKDFPDCVRYTLAYRPTYMNLRMSVGNSVPLANLKLRSENPSFMGGARV